MWGQTPQEVFRRQAAETLPENLHHRDDAQTAPDDDDNDDSNAISSGTTEVPSSETASTNNAAPTWGERDVGGPVCRLSAMNNFGELQHELARLTTTRSRASHVSAAVSRTTSRADRRQSLVSRLASRVSRRKSNVVGDEEAEDEDESAAESLDDDEFPLEQFMRDGFLRRDKTETRRICRRR